MAKVMLDTNIVLDYVGVGRPRHADAVALMETSFLGDDLELCFSSASLKDVYYILCRKGAREDIVRERLCSLTDVLTLIDLTREVIDHAFESNEPDFEDGIVRAMAELNGVDAIITRDVTAYQNAAVPAMDARRYLAEHDFK